ncbi:MAG TPA: NAD(P)-binding protein [Roseiarcus sp.]|jgi:2,4-dienoyl-CoA reductase-like NADH-dependent reductase (Old Yellow Enzyme family)
MTATPAPSYPNVARGLRLRGKSLRSRVYLPGHQPGLADDGLPGERYIAYHRARARAGLGMQITGATPVVWSDVWADGLTLVNIDDRIVPGYRRLAAAVHAEGGLMLAQLAHVGAMETAGDAIVSASGVRSEITQRTAREASASELSAILEAYRAAARRCREGELDGVEVTMAHGMLLASFLSPLMNHREDSYGGDREGRTAFPREVLAAVRDAVGPEAIIGVRLPGDELVEGGIDAQEAAAIAQRLVREGEVDYVSVTAGNNMFKLARVDHWPPTPAPFGAFRHLSRAVKSAVDVPVATVGRVTTLALAEEILAAGDADLVGMVRAHIADPELMPKSRAVGGAALVRPCIGANVCINSLLAHKPLTCLANPDVGRPDRKSWENWGDGWRAIVVGAGPAGLEAARRLALGGWATTLIEREQSIGGQMARWSQTPSRREFLRLVDWWGREAERLGVELRLGEAATVADIMRQAPDLVVIATGSTPVLRPAPRHDAPIPEVGPYDPVAPGGHVVVRDEMGGLAALLTAERLSLTAARVTLATSMLHPGEGEGLTTTYPLIRDCAARGVAIVDRAKVASIEGRTVHLSGVFGEARPPIQDVDAVVSVLDAVADCDLAAPLMARGVLVLTIGDARLPRDVTAATADAARLIDSADLGARRSERSILRDLPLEPT